MKQDQPHRSMARLFLSSCRRIAIALAWIGAVAALCLLYARFVEPTWLSVKTIALSNTPAVTLIHISDIHYKGDRKYLTRVVEIINATEADFVCFTGDLVEEKEYLSECMTLLSGINKPLYGVLGNHDQWALVRKKDVAEQFAATGGRWFINGDTATYSDRVVIVGDSAPKDSPIDRGDTPIMKKVLLSHYPSIVARTPKGAYDLILAGHTHGGQVRIPFVENPVLIDGDTTYARGLFYTEAGPLYVNSGIGTFYWPVRFRCRPEITIIEL
jgi:predicted MPP superfamily phosphohydrolase